MHWPVRIARWCLGVVLMLALMLVWWQAQQNTLLVTDLAELLPADVQISRLERQAEAANEAALNSQLIVLVGARSQDEAIVAAAKVSQYWRQSGVFAQVVDQIQPDLALWQREAKQMRLAILPADVAEVLLQQPQVYFRQRAEDLVNPFAPPSLQPAQEDWLGLGRYVAAKTQVSSQLHWDEASGRLLAHEDDTHWVMVRASLAANQGVVAVPKALLTVLHDTAHMAQNHQWSVLVAGGAVFAAQARAAGEYEGRWMGVTGISLTLLLLLGLFRQVRVVLLLVPLFSGMLLGLAACVVVFGHVHLLTLVIGTSLVGVLIDFPLHWLTPALVNKQWRAHTALNAVLPVFAISLLVTATGYVLLLLTPLPVLRQTAIFSAVALIGAFAATVLWLPLWFARWQPGSNGWLHHAVFRVAWFLHHHRRAGLILGVCMLPFVLMGLLRSHWHDDIRQWVHLSSDALQQAQAVGRITGVAPSGQFFLLEADSEQALLQADAQLSARLAQLPTDVLDGFQSLSQWVLPVHTQSLLKQQLQYLSGQPSVWADMTLLGVDDELMRTALGDAAQTPLVTVAEGLTPSMAQAWQPLYLGEVEPGRFASWVRLQGVHDVAQLQAVAAPMPQVSWVDQPARLNVLFEQTRNQAAWLKMISFVLAWLVLVWLLKWRRGTVVLATPLMAALATVAVLGWLGYTVGLFAMFGLLLVSAIGVDYALYVTAANDDGHEHLAGMMLAAITTLISFVLLSLSSTPAVSSFGLTVAIGVVFNVLLVMWLLPKK